MHPSLDIDPADPAPIWRQIEGRLRRLVAAGSLVPGEPVPSVRELARALRINPATVAKAYQRLTDAGVLRVQRGEGTFVADQPPALADEERDRVLTDGASRYAATALSVDVTLAHATVELERAWAQLQPPETETES
jgi:GntR family transcriptional regulator